MNIIYSFYMNCIHHIKTTGIKISGSRGSRKDSSERYGDKTVLSCLILYTETMLYSRKYSQ